MQFFRILILCISAALVCASLRMMHPQIASAVALAAGIAALMLSTEDIRGLSDAINRLEAVAGQTGKTQIHLWKLCGIAMIAEFASDICRDADENALARRIDAGVKIGIVAASIPTAVRLMEKVVQILA